MSPEVAFGFCLETG